MSYLVRMLLLVQQMESDMLTYVLFQPQSYGKTPQAAEKSPLHGWLDLGMRMSVIFHVMSVITVSGAHT